MQFTSPLIVPKNFKDAIKRQKKRGRVLKSLGKTREEQLTVTEKRVLQEALAHHDKVIEQRKLDDLEMACSEAGTCSVDIQVEEAKLEDTFEGEIDYSVEFIQIIGIPDVDADDLGLEWEVIKADGDGIDIKLSFTNPINISQGDSADFIFVVLNLE